MSGKALLAVQLLSMRAELPCGMRDPHLIRVAQAAALTGLPLSTLRKSFMKVPPKNVPPPPPHKRIGRSVYIMADKLEEWVASLPSPEPARRRGRPTKAEEIARRTSAVA